MPDEFSRDPDRVSRFQREAEVLASLNHPNIAAIYDLQETNGSRYLVLELVEGETLAERIKRGPIPIDEALNSAKSICEALEAAHDKGVVHRDLKPANVKITPEGTVKVLDFGLAKAIEPQGAASMSASPTLLTGGQTQGNVLMGTAEYMSPEQMRGHAADQRSDVWAFGCVLYEMLTGQQPFTGETVTDLISGIIRIEPDWNALPANAPPALRSIVKRCLHKDRRRRFHAIGDVLIDLEQALTPPAAEGPKRRERLAWAVSGVLLLIAGASAPLAIRHLREPAADTRATRFVVNAPGNATFLGTPPAISPDGRRVAFVASAAGGTQLWVRGVESVTGQPLPGTENADHPFWSPDSRFIAFFAGGKLKKIDASGGPPQTLCDAGGGRGGTWNRDDIIIFAPSFTGPLHIHHPAARAQP